jgi:transmembrane sensor
VNKEELQILLKQFADGQISRPDYETLIREVQRLQSEDTLLEGMNEVWQQLQQNTAFNDIPNERLYNAIITDERFTMHLPEQKSGGLYRLLRGPWRQLAAGILVIGCVTWLYFLFSPFNRRSVPQKVNWQQLVTAAGERRQFKLPDSSSVWLNAGSRLLYAASFNTTGREVFLEGEAFFDVVHNDNAPFMVHTGKVSTQVEGTAFDVQAYGTEQLTVTVLRGRVRVAEGTNRLASLTANKQLHYTTGSKKVDVLAVQAANVVAWKNGELILNNISMQEAAVIIGRWYNVDLIFKSQQVKKCKVSVSFLRGETIREVMEVISRLNDFHYRIAGNQVTITGKGCP